MKELIVVGLIVGLHSLGLHANTTCEDILQGASCDSVPHHTQAYRMCCAPLTEGEIARDVASGEADSGPCGTIESYGDPRCNASFSFNGCSFNEDATEIVCGTRVYVLQRNDIGENRHQHGPRVPAADAPGGPAGPIPEGYQDDR